MEIGYLLPKLSRLAVEVAFFPLLGVVDTRRLAVEVAPDFPLLSSVGDTRFELKVFAGHRHFQCNGNPTIYT